MKAWTQGYILAMVVGTIMYMMNVVGAGAESPVALGANVAEVFFVVIIQLVVLAIYNVIMRRRNRTKTPV